MASAYLKSLPPEHFPNLTSLSAEFALADNNERFELLIDIFVDGLARHAVSSREAERRSLASPEAGAG